jgi:hypothetical protein
MATATQLRRIAISLPGTTDAPHFEHTALKVRHSYAPWRQTAAPPT